MIKQVKVFGIIGILILSLVILSSCGDKKIEELETEMTIIDVHSCFNDDVFSLELDVRDNKDGQTTANFFVANESISDYLKVLKDNEYYYSSGDNFIRFLHNGIFYMLEYIGDDDGHNKYVLRLDYVPFMNIAEDGTVLKIYAIPFPSELTRVTSTKMSTPGSNWEYLTDFYADYKAMNPKISETTIEIECPATDGDGYGTVLISLVNDEIIYRISE